MKHLIEQPHIILSVENPLEKPQRQISHEAAMAAFKKTGSGEVHEVAGQYGRPERSILISNPDENQLALARTMAHQSGQESHIESDGLSHKMLYSNGPEAGKVVHGKGTAWHEQKPEDYYTTLPDGSMFSHNFNFGKSETLEKASKNVREQKRRVFGVKAQPSPGPMREKTLDHLRNFVSRRYGLDLQPSGGKINEKTGQRRSDNPEVGVDKPDWRSGKFEAQWSPDAVVHETGHLELMPEGVGLEEGQRLMDQQYADVQRKHGYMKQKRSSYEKEPMAMENPIRRRAGLPPTYRDVPVKPGEPERMTVDTNEPAAVRLEIGDKTVDQLAHANLLRPESRQRQRDIDEGVLKFHPQKGWYRSSSPDALVNLRGQGRVQEAWERAAQKFGQQKPKKMAASEMAKSKDPMSSRLTSEKGVSELGIEARRADTKQKGVVSHGYGRSMSPEKHKERAKAYAKQSLKETKAMPKPNLPKSEGMAKRCWEGYKPVPGKKPYTKGSCMKKSGDAIEMGPLHLVYCQNHDGMSHVVVVDPNTNQEIAQTEPSNHHIDEHLDVIAESAEQIAEQYYGSTGGEIEQAPELEKLEKNEIAMSIFDDGTVDLIAGEAVSDEMFDKICKKIEEDGFEPLGKKEFSLRSEHRSKSGGLTEKGRKAYNRATGSNLKRPQPEGGKRKKSFCARNAGQLKMHNIDCRKTPKKRACLARKRWKC